MWERNDPGGRGPNPRHRCHPSPGSDRSTGRGDNVDPEEIQYALEPSTFDDGIKMERQEEET